MSVTQNAHLSRKQLLKAIRRRSHNPAAPFSLRALYTVVNGCDILTSPNVSQGGGEWRKAARSAGGARSISGNHGAGLLRRSFLATSAGVYRFFVRARHTTPSTQRFAQIRLATASLSAAQSCNLQLPVHPAEQLEMRIAGRQRHPDLAYGDANLGPDLEQL